MASCKRKAQKSLGSSLMLRFLMTTHEEVGVRNVCIGWRKRSFPSKLFTQFPRSIYGVRGTYSWIPGLDGEAKRWNNPATTSKDDMNYYPSSRPVDARFMILYSVRGITANSAETCHDSWHFASIAKGTYFLYEVVSRSSAPFRS